MLQPSEIGTASQLSQEVVDLIFTQPRNTLKEMIGREAILKTIEFSTTPQPLSDLSFVRIQYLRVLLCSL